MQRIKLAEGRPTAERVVEPAPSDKAASVLAAAHAETRMRMQVAANERTLMQLQAAAECAHDTTTQGSPAALRSVQPHLQGAMISNTSRPEPPMVMAAAINDSEEHVRPLRSHVRLPPLQIDSVAQTPIR